MYIQYNLALSIFLYLTFLVFSREPKFIINIYTRRFEGEHYRIFLLILMVYMVFVRSCVLPSSVSDIQNYQRALIETGYMSWNQLFHANSGVRIEVGYRALMKLYSYISLDINGFLFFHAIISQFLLFRILSKYSSGPFLSLIIYNIVMFCPSIYILRQYLAMLICYHGLNYILDRKLLKFMICIIISVTIHNIAIVFFPIYFIYGVKSKINLIITLVLVFIILKVSFSALYYYFGASVFGGYDTYLFTDKYKVSNYTESLIDLCYLVPFVVVSRKKIFIPGMDKFLFVSMIMGFFISFTGTSLPMIGRLALFYTFSVVFLIPRTISYMKSSFVRCIFVLFVLFMMYKAFFHDENMGTYQLMF